MPLVQDEPLKIGTDALCRKSFGFFRPAGYLGFILKNILCKERSFWQVVPSESRLSTAYRPVYFPRLTGVAYSVNCSCQQEKNAVLQNRYCAAGRKASRPGQDYISSSPV